jgi:cytochrome b561
MTDNTSAPPKRFTLVSRLLHWSMAAMVIAQLLIGVTMVASLSYYPLLLAIHRPLGVAILVFAVVRLFNRLTHRPPPFLATMGPLERRVATWSEYLLYALLLTQPLVGWAMLSAARFPVVLFGPVLLPGIAPHNITLYAILRFCHSLLALLLFLTFTAHMCAVLFHTLVLRDRLIDRMALWPTKASDTGGRRKLTVAQSPPGDAGVA